MEQQLLYSDQQLLNQVWQDRTEIDILITIEESEEEEEEEEVTIAPSPEDVYSGRVSLQEIDLDYDSSEDDEEEEEQTDCRYCSGCYYCDINLEFDIRNEI